MAREGYYPLKKFIQTTLLPNIYQHYSFYRDFSNQIENIISWRLFAKPSESVIYLLNVIQRLVSETKFEVPFFQTINRLSTNKSIQSSNIFDSSPQKRAQKSMYVYTYHQSRTLDIRGAINYFGGASHTSDLLFLMGPTLFQQISRRKVSSYELRLCKRIRHFFTEFIKTGNPTPGRIFDAWHPYTSKQKFIQILGDISLSDELNSGITNNFDEKLTMTFDWEKNAQDIESLIHSQVKVLSINTLNPYRIGKDEIISKSNDSQKYKTYFGSNEWGYYDELVKINSFWTELLPKINSQQIRKLDILDSRYDDQSVAANTSGNNKKFKHAFFSVLILMCLMLILLCICVIILKKRQGIENSSFL